MKRLTAVRNSSIRSRLTLLVVLNGSLALLLVGTFLFGYEKFENREAATRELSTQARIVAVSSTAALSFADEPAATETLNALRADPNLVEAAIYDRHNRLFARFQRGSSSGRPPEAPRRTGVYFENGNLLVSQPILLGREQIGAVLLKHSMSEVNLRLRRYTGIVCLVLLVSLGVALMLSARMQRAITEPIAELSKVARLVSGKKDYSVRAARHTTTEIGFLIDSFNEMLSQIEFREEARRGAEESLRESEERYALAARGANDGLWDWKLTTGKIYFSPRWNQMLGDPETEKWTDPEDWFSRIHPSDRERVKSEIAAHREGRTKEFVSEYRIRKRNGTFIWMLSRGIVVRDAAGTAVRMAGSQTDITEGKIADPLTGLSNRLYFMDRLENSIEAARYRDVRFAVLFLDLDRFKLINDSLGHAAGDELLEGIAGRLRARVREFDAVHGGRVASIASRLGGDEFGILVNIHQPSEAALLADRILQHLSAPFQIDGRQVFATVSIGIALSSSGDTPEELLRRADTAMYRAKTGGKARFAVFDEGMRTEAISRLEIETELRTAIDERQLTLHYQPQVSIHGQRITGFEALVRWKHPVRGLVQPSEFIPVAEETDLIVPLGRWVLGEACRQMAEWQRDVAFEPPLTIAVNVSFKQLTDAGFVEDVRRILAETGLCPGTLKLEMTESAVMENPAAAIDTLRRLKDLNAGLEIDDFGTGYSSLSHLNSLPFDTLKINRSFVGKLSGDKESWAIVKTILDLARSMNLDVVAEGVETADQLQTLAALGCARAQGYYFSKPVAADAVPRLFQVEALKRAFRRLEGQPAAPAEELEVEAAGPRGV
jgi:diguanylate cyclase (GGDEF)-like protein/PAS domain S-box-containing protein